MKEMGMPNSRKYAKKGAKKEVKENRLFIGWPSVTLFKR